MIFKLHPDDAKAEVEKVLGATPVFSQGKHKGEHTKRNYVFKLTGQNGQKTRHIVIPRDTADGVTVYVNGLSANGVLFSEEGFRRGSLEDQVKCKERYPPGHEGKNGYPGMSRAAASLLTRDTDDKEVLRLSISSVAGFRRLLDWYAARAVSESPSPAMSIPARKSSTQSSQASDEKLDSRNAESESASIPLDEQEKFAEDTKTLTTGEREALVKVRYGQGKFRDNLLPRAGEAKCWMSGIEGKHLLIASHIKPWSDCKSEPHSRGNPENGLLLSALWDSAFDSGLISFDPQYQVVASSELSESARESLNLRKHFELPEEFRKEARKEYLAYHLANVFRREQKPPMPPGSR